MPFVMAGKSDQYEQAKNQSFWKLELQQLQQELYLRRQLRIDICIVL